MSETQAPYIVTVTTPVIEIPTAISDDEARIIAQIRRLKRDGKPFRLTIEYDGVHCHLWEGRRAGII